MGDIDAEKSVTDLSLPVPSPKEVNDLIDDFEIKALERYNASRVVAMSVEATAAANIAHSVATQQAYEASRARLCFAFAQLIVRDLARKIGGQ